MNYRLPGAVWHRICMYPWQNKAATVRGCPARTKEWEETTRPPGAAAESGLHHAQPCHPQPLP